MKIMRVFFDVDKTINEYTQLFFKWNIRELEHLRALYNSCKLNCHRFCIFTNNSDNKGIRRLIAYLTGDESLCEYIKIYKSY